MIEIYISDTDELMDPKVNPGRMEGLDEGRKSKLLRFKRAEDRKESLGAGLLLLDVLKKHGKRVEDINYTRYGKPVIDGIYFNLSHSKGKVVCVVSDCEIGCDIERIGSERNGLAERYFTLREQEYLESIASEKRTEEFYRIWTMKEAYLKMTGEGLQVPFKQVEFIIGDEIEVWREGKKLPCKIMEQQIPDYRLSIAVNSPLVKETVKVIDYSIYV